MKRFLCLMFIPFLAYAQGDGIKFEDKLTWKQILAKAKAENKYVFVDCYATWCGPCKYMSRNIFTQKAIGDYFNAHFISVAVQMDKTDKDADEIKQWYSDADSLAKSYSVNAYPTYLFFSPAGKPLHRIIGATEESDEFLSKVKATFDPGKQYYTTVYQYKDHPGDSAFLRNALDAAIASSDNTTAYDISRYYINNIKEPCLKENLQIILDWTRSSTDKAFKLLLDDPSRIDSIFGEKGVADARMRRIIVSEEIDPLLKMEGSPDWDKASQVLTKKYPVQAGKVLSYAKQHYYYAKKQWPEYEKAAIYYLNGYGLELGDRDINSIVWALFKFSNDSSVLSECIKWSKHTVENYPEVYDWSYVHTYASLLYKTGQKENAITWEQKAIVLVKDEDGKKALEAVLMKMQQDQKTW